MRKLITTFAVLLLALTGCTASDTSKYSCNAVDGTSYFRCTATLTEVGASMNGSEIAVNFTGYVRKKSAFDPLVDMVKSEYLRLNHIFDKYNDVEGVNNLKTVNDQAGIAPVTVDQELIDLLLIAKDWTTKSEGTFDITLGAVLKIWHDYREAGQDLNSNGQLGPIPSLTELQAAQVYTGWNYVEIDDAANTVYLNNPHASLDLGGISKGYATDLVAAKLKEAGLEAGLLSFGGSSSVVIGEKPNGLNWNVAVRAPIRGNPYVEIDYAYFPSSFALSSSGDDQNYYQGTDSNFYHHIIDPSTLYPVNNGCHSVTVFTTENATVAEALSKTLYILPLEQAYAYLNQYNLDHPDQTLYAIWIFDYQKAPAGYDTVDFQKGSGDADAPYTLLYSNNLKGMTLSFK